MVNHILTSLEAFTMSLTLTFLSLVRFLKFIMPTFQEYIALLVEKPLLINVNVNTT